MRLVSSDGKPIGDASMIEAIKQNLNQLASHTIDGLIENKSLGGVLTWSDEDGKVVAACAMFIGKAAVETLPTLLECVNKTTPKIDIGVEDV